MFAWSQMQICYECYDKAQPASSQGEKKKYSFGNDSLRRRFECLLSCTQKEKKKAEKKEKEKLSTPLLLLTSSKSIENREIHMTWQENLFPFLLSEASSGIIFLIFSGIIGWKKSLAVIERKKLFHVLS